MASTIGTIARRLANHEDPRSLARRFRARRFALLSGLLDRLPRPWRLLDVGGTPGYWRDMGFRVPDGCEITILNLGAERERIAEGIVTTPGDARALEYGNASFDVVFSNSVIEHLGTHEAQRSMAREVMRVGRRYFVQTPNFWFPVEPHFLVPAFQWLPRQARIAIVERFRPGWYGRDVRARADAERVVDEIRLLTRREMRRLFPDATVVTERALGLPKSFVAYAGWDAARS